MIHYGCIHFTVYVILHSHFSRLWIGFGSMDSKVYLCTYGNRCAPIEDEWNEEELDLNYKVPNASVIFCRLAELYYLMRGEVQISNFEQNLTNHIICNQYCCPPLVIWHCDVISTIIVGILPVIWQKHIFQMFHLPNYLFPDCKFSLKFTFQYILLWFNSTQVG